MSAESAELLTNKQKVKVRYPNATPVHDYNSEAAWCHIYESCDEDGFGEGKVIGFGGPGDEEAAWKDAADSLAG